MIQYINEFIHLCEELWPQKKENLRNFQFSLAL